MTRLLAHQGGWDEIAMVAGPLLVFAAVLYLANRRANQKLAAARAAGGGAATDSAPDADSEPVAD